MIALLFILNLLGAEEIYPDPTAVRVFGSDQGNVGSCMADAEVAALEHAFAARQLSVRLSTFYRHAYNWRDSAAQPSVSQSYAPGDRALFGQLGPLVPYYLLPEDGSLLDPRRTGRRMPVSTMIVNAGERWGHPRFGLSERFHPFSDPTWRSLEAIKSAVRRRAALTITIHSDLLEHFFDHRTGLIQSLYTFPLLLNLLDNAGGENQGKRQSIDHAVALVGFDDELYADLNFPGGPGAFIVRNSWNSRRLIHQLLSMRDFGPKRYPFRAKISRWRNEPGYYAIPYQYVADLIHHGLSGAPQTEVGGVTELDLDYAAYAAEYVAREKEYEVINVPFTCNIGGSREILRLYKSALKDASSWWPATAERGREIVGSTLASRWGNADGPFKIASLARTRDGRIDRVTEFLAGSYNSYYCNTDERFALMPPAVSGDPRFAKIVSRLSSDPHDVLAWQALLSLAIENDLTKE